MGRSIWASRPGIWLTATIFAPAILTAASLGAGYRTLRVGADNAPPYHTIQADGSIHGFAVDILNEAARRRKIRLIWVAVPTESMDTALATGVVDLWPALSRTPARDKVLHFSKPWLESSYCLLSRKETDTAPDKTRGISIGVAASPRVTSLALKFFPQALHQPFPTNISAVQAVCGGGVTAAFLDARTLDSALLDRPAGCETASFRIQFVHEAANPVSLAGRLDTADSIDDLRQGITALIADGTFSAALDRWSGFSGAQTRSYFALREAQTRATTFLYAFIVLFLGAGLLIWQRLRQIAAQRRAKIAQQATVDSESRFHAFMEHSPMVGFMKDQDGKLVYANQRFTEIFEPILGQFIGKSDYDLWPEEAAAKIRKDDLAVLSNWRSAETTDRVPGASGETRTWLSMKFPVRMGGKIFLGGLSADITHREHAEAILRRSEERFRTAFHHAFVGMSVNDLAGRFLQVNPALCEITGYTAAELSEMDFVALTHPDDREMGARKRAAALAAGQTGFRVEKRYLHKGGLHVWVRISVGIVRDSDSEPSGYIALVEDITAERNAGELALLSERRWQLALQATNDGIWDWDARANTVFFSPRYKEMLGYEDA